MNAELPVNAASPDCARLRTTVCLILLVRARELQALPGRKWRRRPREKSRTSSTD
jgi:hypothetical protein